MNKIIVYSKQYCVQCNQTKKTLTQKGLEYEEIMIDDTENETILENLKSEGFLQAPIVKVIREDGVVLDKWSGFNPEKINNIRKGK